MSEVLWARQPRKTVYFSYTASEVPYSCFPVDCVAMIVFQVIFSSLFFPHSLLFDNFHCFPNFSFPSGSFSRICQQCRTLGFNLWFGNIPWRRERLPTPVFLPGEFHGQKSLSMGSSGLQSMESQRLGYTEGVNTYTYQREAEEDLTQKRKVIWHWNKML